MAKSNAGESENGFLKRAVTEAIEHDSAETVNKEG